MGFYPPGISGGPERPRWPRGLGQGAKHTCTEHTVVPWWLRGSRSIEQDHPYLPWRGGLSSRQSRRKKPALWYSRARDGCHRQRTFSIEGSGLWSDILHIQRLRTAGDPASRGDGVALSLRLHT